MYPIFIKTCEYANNNSRLLFVLVNLSRGCDFFFGDTFTKVTHKDIIVTKSSKQTVYNYTGRQPIEICRSVSHIYEIKEDPVHEEKNIKEYNLRDYVVNCIYQGKVFPNEASKIYEYLILCQILKLFSSKNVILSEGKIIEILSVDVNDMSLKGINHRQESKLTKRKRMDILFLNK